MHQQQLFELEEEERMAKPRLPLWTRRLLVIALCLCFLACLLAIWLTGTLFGSLDQSASFWLFQTIANHRIIALAIPFACLIVCYAALRSVTGEIMAVPARYLDERQKMIRDRAHRSAFAILKLVCCLPPVLLLIQYLPWWQKVPPHPASQGMANRVSYVVFIAANPPHQTNLEARMAAVSLIRWSRVSPTVMPPLSVAAASPSEIAFAAVIFLLCLLMLISALPMSVIAWKKHI